jgi:hypothetical protein
MGKGVKRDPWYVNRKCRKRPDHNLLVSPCPVSRLRYDGNVASKALPATAPRKTARCSHAHSM